MERCHHNLPKIFCSICNPIYSSQKRNPTRSTQTTVFGQEAIQAKSLKTQGYAVIYTSKRDNPTFRRLDKNTTMVHIHGHPFIWAIERILKEAPNLRTIRIIPTMKRHIHPAHQKLCNARGVEIITGHHRPNIAWGENENRSPHYQNQRRFLLHLQGEQRHLFDELIEFGFETAEMTSRYFCLKEEEFLPQLAVGRLYGWDNNILVSLYINGILVYLDPSFKTGSHSMTYAETLRERVLRLREIVKIDNYRREFAKEIGVPKIPSRLPASRFWLYAALLEAQKNNLFELLESEHSRAYKTLCLRFGFDDTSGETYRTLEEVGSLIGNLTRERIRQLENKALSILGLESQ